jgi:hypothetical protein
MPITGGKTLSQTPRQSIGCLGALAGAGCLLGSVLSIGSAGLFSVVDPSGE